MSQSAPFSAYAAPNSPVSARISLQPGRGNLLDELMAMGAFVIMPLGFPMAQPLRLPFTILLILWLGMNWRSILPVVRKGWPLLVLPVLCLLSALWADNMMVAIRYGALFSLAMLFAAGVASRLDARQVAVAIVCGQGMLAVASALTDSQTLAFLGTLLTLVCWVLITNTAPKFVGAELGTKLAAASYLIRIDDFARGAIDTRHIVFFLSISAALLVMAAAALEHKRWR